MSLMSPDHHLIELTVSSLGSLVAYSVWPPLIINFTMFSSLNLFSLYAWFPKCEKNDVFIWKVYDEISNLDFCGTDLSLILI